MVLVRVVYSLHHGICMITQTKLMCMDPYTHTLLPQCFILSRELFSACSLTDLIEETTFMMLKLQTMVICLRLTVSAVTTK